MRRKSTIKENDTIVYAKITRVMLGFLISVLFIGVFGGIVKTFLDLQLLLTQNVEISLRQSIVNTLVIFALVELLRTAINYLKEGRVRVTFIIDTVLIIMFNEFISLWFKEHQSAASFGLLIAIVTVLMGARLLAIRYSPEID